MGGGCNIKIITLTPMFRLISVPMVERGGGKVRWERLQHIDNYFNTNV